MYRNHMRKIKNKGKKPIRFDKISPIYFHVPAYLKMYYKAYCAKRGITMKDAFIEHMKDATKYSIQADYLGSIENYDKLGFIKKHPPTTDESTPNGVDSDEDFASLDDFDD